MSIPWPTGADPFPFQREGVDKLYSIITKTGGALLCDEMGLGKTAQAAVLASRLTGRTLVVCPAAVRHQWVKWLSATSWARGVELGPPSDKAFGPNWSEWVSGSAVRAVTSYALMDKALETSPKPRILVLDEIHNYLQGRANKYVKTLWKHSALIDYKLGLTGSPLVSKPAGLWQILNVLFGMRFGKARDWDVRYCAGHQDPRGWWNNTGTSAENLPELKTKLSAVMVRRMKSEVADQLPKVTRTVRWVEGTPAGRAAMQRMATTAHGMRQAMDPTLAGKISQVVEVAEENNGPTVTFCWRRNDCEMVAQAFDKAGLPWSVIHGEYDATARAAMVEAAKESKAHVITTYGASATGLDGLQHFISHAIFHAIDPVVATLLQAGARLNRIGQTMPVTETYVAMRDSVDEILVDRVVERLSTHEAVLGKDLAAQDLSNAVQAAGLGNLADDAVLQAIFDNMTGGSDDMELQEL